MWPFWRKERKVEKTDGNSSDRRAAPISRLPSSASRSQPARRSPSLRSNASSPSDCHEASVIRKTSHKGNEKLRVRSPQPPRRRFFHRLRRSKPPKNGKLPPHKSKSPYPPRLTDNDRSLSRPPSAYGSRPPSRSVSRRPSRSLDRAASSNLMRWDSRGAASTASSPFELSSQFSHRSNRTVHIEGTHTADAQKQSSMRLPPSRGPHRRGVNLTQDGISVVAYDGQRMEYTPDGFRLHRKDGTDLRVDRCGTMVMQGGSSPPLRVQTSGNFTINSGNVQVSKDTLISCMNKTASVCNSPGPYFGTPGSYPYTVGCNYRAAQNCCYCSCRGVSNTACNYLPSSCPALNQQCTPWPTINNSPAYYKQGFTMLPFNSNMQFSGSVMPNSTCQYFLPCLPSTVM